MLGINDFTIQIRQSVKVSLGFALQDTTDETYLSLLKNTLTLLQENNTRINSNDEEKGDNLEGLKMCLNDPILTLFANRNPGQYSSEDREVAKLLCKIALLGAIVEAVKDKSIVDASLCQDISACRDTLAKQWGAKGQGYLAYLDRTHRQVHSNQIVMYQGIRIVIALMLVTLLYGISAELPSRMQTEGSNIISGVSNYATGEKEVDLVSLAQDTGKFIVDVLILAMTLYGVYTLDHLVSSTGTFATALNKTITEQRNVIAKVQEDIRQFTPEVKRSLEPSAP